MLEKIEGQGVQRWDETDDSTDTNLQSPVGKSSGDVDAESQIKREVEHDWSDWITHHHTQ